MNASSAMTVHGNKRLQQRALPPLIVNWLQGFGRECHDKHGAVILYFDKKACRTLERTSGRRLVAHLAHWLDAYAVIGNDGALITVGYRYVRLRH